MIRSMTSSTMAAMAVALQLLAHDDHHHARAHQCVVDLVEGELLNHGLNASVRDEAQQLGDARCSARRRERASTSLKASARPSGDDSARQCGDAGG